MTREEAINILDRAVSTLQVDRNTHAKLQEAIMVLREKLKKKEQDG